MDDNKNAATNLDEYLYKKQFQETMNPIFMFLTKEGIIYLTLSIITYLWSDGGVVWLLFFFLIGKYIYKNKFNYKYYEYEKLWIIQLISKYINHRKVTSHTTYIK
ncbi:MAG: Unknown protein [uncultured Sulfurovum sp.]|uniref:Uncharacterized protein n=1 Tax=uncultured Sulfurovum sp. TaxID=269237 RepID=A0A6S6SZT6_9BACT|nr:MAG: Unknown protein [uncultured Sulfurovum sp.]